MYVLLLLLLYKYILAAALLRMPGIPPGQKMLVCIAPHRIHGITRIYRHFTYMLLAHVMQSALTGSLLRSGTALVDSRQRPSIDRRAAQGAAARKKDTEP